MRLVFMLTAIMTQLFLTNIGWADAYEDCKTSCEADRESRDMDCPSPYDAASTGDRDLCLKNNQEAYNSCIKGCPPPPIPSQSPPLPLGY